MNCTYCSALAQSHRGKTKETIDINFAKKAIEYYFTKEEYNQIRFFGAGEPTLELEKIDDLLKYANLFSSKRVISEIQTNGQISEENLPWFAENIDKIWVSLDGYKEINNRYRASLLKFENIENSIRYLSAKTFVGIRTTIHKDTNSHQKEIIDYFKSLGVRIIYAEPEYENTLRSSSFGKLGMMEFAQEFYKAFQYAKSQGLFYGTSFISNFDEEVEISCRCSLPAPHLTTDGYITCCDFAYFGTTSLRQLVIGKWDNIKNEIIFFSENIKSVQERNIYNLKACQSCEILKYCAGGCTGISYLRTGNLLSVDKEVCATIKFLATKIKPKSFAIPELHP